MSFTDVEKTAYEKPEDVQKTILGRVLLYVRDVEAVAAFYARHFGFEIYREQGDRIVELVGPDGSGNIMLHSLGQGRKNIQSVVKLVFDVEDVEAFCAAARRRGLNFGTIQKADGYVFANAKDPAGNPISVSSRKFRHA